MSKGILFKADMVRALLNTRPDCWPPSAIEPSQPWKWQTRRFFKEGKPCPYPAGTILYAKETWAVDKLLDDCKPSDLDWKPISVGYRAGGGCEFNKGGVRGKWRPSIFMPKPFARLWFEVACCHVERVNEISEADALAEGVADNAQSSAIASYEQLWDYINGEGSFEQGPMVWVYHLRRINPPTPN